MSQKLAKVNASPQADEALNRMLEKVNENFDGGRITKAEILTWILLRFEKSEFRNSIAQIRKAHFDEVAYLESFVSSMKRSKKDGAERMDISELLSVLKRRAKKSSPPAVNLQPEREPK